MPARAEAPRPPGSAWHDLLPALWRLDALLERAVAAAAGMQGENAGAAEFRGLYVSDADALRLVAEEPGGPLLGDGREDDLPGALQSARLASLAEVFGLSEFDVDVLLLPLAAEVDRRYERVYGYLHDDVTRRRPSVDLALSLLCSSAEERLLRRLHFAPGAPLVGHRLIELAPPPDGSSGLLCSEIELDGQTLRMLIDGPRLDPRLESCCRLDRTAPAEGELPLDTAEAGRLRALVERSRQAPRALRLYLRGAPGSGAATLARWLAAGSGGLLCLDLRRAVDAPHAVELAVREAWMHGTLLYVEGLDAAHTAALHEVLLRIEGPVLLAGADAWPAGEGELPLGILEINLGVPTAAVRRRLWQLHSRRAGARPSQRQLDELAGRFRLRPLQIAEAAMGAAARAAAESALNGRARISKGHLFAAARAQSGRELAGLADKIQPRRDWGDLVLPPETIGRLRDLCNRAASGETVLEDWGFAARLSNATGVTALFTGASGTGKTLSAEIVAGELGLDLYRIDLSGVVSKYIGETEKNLDRVFAAAECSNAVLLFDEADALFGKRSEVRDSHDRYANVEISYLLQRMEAYDGLAILTTNLAENLDRAFTRRLAFTIQFPFPDEAERRRLWRLMWPDGTPLAQDLDLDSLARAFRLSGGHIRNIVLAAAFLAASPGGGGKVTMAHLRTAVQREHEKLGRRLPDPEAAA